MLAIMEAITNTSTSTWKARIFLSSGKLEDVKIGDGKLQCRYFKFMWDLVRRQSRILWRIKVR